MRRTCPVTYVTGLERGRKAMRSAFVVAASLPVSLSMSACWPQRGFDAATGEVRWRAELGDVTDVPPTVVGRRTIVVGASDGRLAAFPAGGCGADVCEPDWETEATGAPVWLAAAGDVVFAASWSTGEVRAFDLDGCREATCEPLAELDVGDRISGGPIVHDGRLIVGTSAGHVVAFRLPRPSS